MWYMKLRPHIRRAGPGNLPQCGLKACAGSNKRCLKNRSRRKSVQGDRFRANIRGASGQYYILARVPSRPSRPGAAPTSPNAIWDVSSSIAIRQNYRSFQELSAIHRAKRVDRSHQCACRHAHWSPTVRLRLVATATGFVRNRRLPRHFKRCFKGECHARATREEHNGD